MLSLLMPRAFTLLNKSVAPGGKSARLMVTGPGQPIIAGARPQPMYGDVKMVNENGEWKVDETSWSDQKPAGVATPARQAAPAAPAPQRPAAQKAGPTQYVPSEPPARRLGAARQECVYKPVMTNEDLERCR
jgi:hypothetical protein